MAQKQIGIQVEQAVEALYTMWTRNRDSQKQKQHSHLQGLPLVVSHRHRPHPPIVPTNQWIRASSMTLYLETFKIQTITLLKISLDPLKYKSFKSSPHKFV